VAASVYFHVAVLVEGLETAMADFGAALGLTFHDPITAEFGRLEDPDPHESFVRCTYSREGPPYIELLEANGDGIFSLKHGEGVHHVGLWHPDVTGACEALSNRGVGTEARVISPDGELFVFFNDPSKLHGTRFEFLDDVAQESTEHWIKTGEFLTAPNL
jgi:hypothetical protein